MTPEPEENRKQDLPPSETDGDLDREVLILSIDQITKEIFIGNGNSAKDPTIISDRKIKGILSLNDGLKPEEASRLGVNEIATFSLIDGEGNDLRVFERAVSTLERMVVDHGQVLIHCHAGRSRSVVIAAGYIMRTRGIEPEDALMYVETRRESAVAPDLKRLLHLINSKPTYYK